MPDAQTIRDRADAAEQKLRLVVATARTAAVRKAIKAQKDGRGRRSGRGRSAMALSGGYEATSRSRVSTGRSRARGGSVDSFLDAQTLDFLRRDGRALMRNNPVARGMMRRCDDMIAGGRGFSAHAATDDPAWNALADAWWDEYWHDKRRCDARGLMNGDELVRAVLKQVKVDGDLICNPLNFGALQFIDAERIVTPDGAKNDRVINGVEVDFLGMPVRYHIAEYAAGGSNLNRTTRALDAESVWFLVRPEWMSQTRGEPRLGAVSEDFQRVRDYMDATLDAAQMAAMFAAVIKTNDPVGSQSYFAAETQTSPTDDSERTVSELQPGMMMHLKPGEEVSQVQAEHPTTTFDTFVVTLLRMIGQELDLPIEIVLLHFGLTNFHSAKSALSIALRSIETWQEWLSTSLLRPWWQWRIQMAIADGELPRNEQFKRVTWTPPPKPNLEPQIKASTDAMLVGAAMKTLSDCAAEEGKDWRQVIDQRAVEIEYMRSKGVPMMPMPGAGGMPTGGQPAPGQGVDPKPAEDDEGPKGEPADDKAETVGASA